MRKAACITTYQCTYMMALLSADTSKQQLRTTTLSLLLVILYCAVNLAPVFAGGSDESTMRARYDSWAAKHGRTHTDLAEKARRYDAFKSNAEFVDSYNDAAGKSNSSLRLATNKFSDLTDEEFEAMYAAGLGSKRFKGAIPGFMYGSLSNVPDSLDWRAKGAVTGVKDQGQCGESSSCFVVSSQLLVFTDLYSTKSSCCDTRTVLHDRTQFVPYQHGMATCMFTNK